MHLSRCHKRRRRSGFSLVEVIVATAVLVIGCLGLSSAITSGARLMDLNRERTLAHEAARAQMETLECATFGQVFSLYNTTKADDPGGAGSGPGPNFAIAGLNAQRGDADGLPGQIVFPTLGGFGSQLAENVVDARLRMPSDLNGDGNISAGVMAGSYTVLPVRVRVAWRGVSGNSVLEIDNVLLDRTH